jgi:short-subunit dehydrogenase
LATFSIQGKFNLAKDAFEVLMLGDDEIIYGVQNKAMVGMGNFMPDSIPGDQMNKQQAPVNES